ncbi:hypothetical protein GKR41_00095 [Candidatus Vallotia lariciata]|nr:hypothetical protein GKR41_00095 [Candidatus Vallotia lariciata]
MPSGTQRMACSEHLATLKRAENETGQLATDLEHAHRPTFKLEQDTGIMWLVATIDK